MTNDGFEKLDEMFEILPFIASPLFNNMMYQTSLNTSTCSSDAPIIFTEACLKLLIPEKKETSEYKILDLDCLRPPISCIHAVNTSKFIESRLDGSNFKLSVWSF